YSGNVNYTGDPGQTLTVLFDSYSSSSSSYAGFDLDVTYTGLCEYDCDAPTVSSEILADCSADTFDVTISIGDDGDADNYLVSYSVNSGDTLEVGTFEGGSIDVLIGSFVTNDLVDVIITHPTDENCTQTLSGLTSTCTVLVPFSGSNTVECGQNVRLMDHAGEANPSVNANGYTVLEAGEEAVINISGTYSMYYYDALRIYDGVGTSGTLLQSFTYSYSGSVNYTGAPGQTLTVLFDSYSSSSSSDTGFDLEVTSTGLCEYDCDAPTVSSEVLPDCSADTFDVTISVGDDGD